MSVSRQRKEVAPNQPAAPHFAPQLSERARPHPHNYARLLRTYAAKPCARKGGGGHQTDPSPLFAINPSHLSLCSMSVIEQHFWGQMF